MKFTEIDLQPEIMKALVKMQYKELTPIQEQTFPHVLSGKDIIATAETGSGKTSACGIPLIQAIDPKTTTIQVLILVPTRELALQYVDEIDRIGQYLNVRPFAVYGGFDADIQKAKLNDLVHILIATPGRLIDLMYGGFISLANVKTFVLDEADEMLNQGFLEDIDFVFSCLVHNHQTLLFSATMPAEIKRLAETYLTDPVSIALNINDVAPQSLEHHFHYLPRGNRAQALVSFMKDNPVKQAIIFCNARYVVDRLFKDIRNSLPQVEMIHGGLDQDKRTSIIRRFRARKIRFMIATDLAGRGLDFTHVNVVFNYDFPPDPVTYTHRTGRTGRMGRTGIALTIITNRDLRTLKRLFSKNRIAPIWLGDAPDLNRVPGRRSKQGKFNRPKNRKGRPGRDRRPPRKKRS